MILDKDTLEKILRLPDDQLLLIIKGLAKESGVDISSINIGKSQLDSIRNALSAATPEDVAKAGDIIKGYRNKPSR